MLELWKHDVSNIYTEAKNQKSNFMPCASGILSE